MTILIIGDGWLGRRCAEQWGDEAILSDKFIEKIAKLGVMEQALSLNDIKQNKDAKKSDGKKTRTVRGVPKLIDANNAGTSTNFLK